MNGPKYEDFEVPRLVPLLGALPGIYLILPRFGRHGRGA